LVRSIQGLFRLYHSKKIPGTQNAKFPVLVINTKKHVKSQIIHDFGAWLLCSRYFLTFESSGDSTIFIML